MRVRVAIPDEHVSPEVIDPVLEAVTRLDEHLIRSGQSPTSRELVKGGAVWRPENMGDEHFDHGGTIAARGWGDCDDWAPLHAATLRASGEDPGATARVIPSGPNTFHAVVQTSGGKLLMGEDDISVMAGMKPLGGSGIVGANEAMMVYACDPHDGRIYQGQLLPTTGPLSVHCGAQMSIRGCTVIGGGRLFEGRVDLPMCGSPLVGVRGRLRRRGRRGRRIHGAVPFAMSVTHHAASPQAALLGAVTGAVMAADASELSTTLDRYKLLSVQSAMAGMGSEDVRAALYASLQHDIPPEGYDLIVDLLAELNAPVTGDYLTDVWTLASSIVLAIGSVMRTVSGCFPPPRRVIGFDLFDPSTYHEVTDPFMSAAGDIIHVAQAAVSFVPGLGTAVSNIVAAAETAYQTAVALLHGNPLEAGIHAAYNFALASIPGASAMHVILDPVVTALIDVAAKGQPIESAVLDGLLSAVPDIPNLGGISPRSIAASLSHLIVSKIGIKPTPGHTPQSRPAASNGAPMSFAAGIQAAAAAAAAKKPAPPPRPPLRVTTVHTSPAAKTFFTAPGTAQKLQQAAATPVSQLTPAQQAARAALDARTAAQKAAAIAPKPLAPTPHAAIPADPAGAPHPTAAPAPALAMPGGASHLPGMPPGATHWHCQPLPGGAWACSWQ